MACRRGNCAGVPICDANVNCFTMEHDAGLGCDTLAAGSSRVQVNAAGELVICSNVGGTCTCLPVCTDCLNSIVGTNTCAAGGIGADYMIRSANFTGGVLTLNGAPEHTSFRARNGVAVPFPGVPHPANPNPLNPTDVLQVTVDLVVNNISPCRRMNVILTSSLGQNIRGYAEPLQFSTFTRLLRNGGVLATNSTLFPASMTNPLQSTTSMFPNTVSALNVGDVGVTFTLEIYSRNYSNQAINQIETSGSLRLLAVTE